MPTEKAGTQDYTRYDQQHEYETVPGVVQLPVASRSSAHRLVRLHGGYGTRIVRWTAERSGRPPVIPSAVSPSGDTLLGTVIVPVLPRPNQSAGGYDWKVSGTYTYAQNTARVPGTDVFPVGQHPFTVWPANSLATALIAAEQATGSFNTLYTTLGDNIVDLESGNYIWPFYALAPVFSSGDLI